MPTEYEIKRAFKEAIKEDREDRERERWGEAFREIARLNQFEERCRRERELEEQKNAHYQSAKDKALQGDTVGVLESLSLFIGWENNYDLEKISGDSAFDSMRRDCDQLIEKTRVQWAKAKEAEKRRAIGHPFALVLQIIVVIMIFGGFIYAEGPDAKVFRYEIITIVPFLVLFFSERYSTILRIVFLIISCLSFLIIFSKLASRMNEYWEYIEAVVPVLFAFILGALAFLASNIMAFIFPK
jgi:hypothetical protein